MIQEKIGAATPKENGDPGLLGGSPGHVANPRSEVTLKAALSATNGSGLSVLRDHEFGRFVDHACVIIQQRRGSAFVLLRCAVMERAHGGTVRSYQRRPWGWNDYDREFPGAAASSDAVQRYAYKLLALIRLRGSEEAARQARQRALREQERLGRLQERGR